MGHDVAGKLLGTMAWIKDRWVDSLYLAKKMLKMVVDFLMGTLGKPQRG